MRKEDYHLHTDLIGCADETMRLPDIAAKCAELGCDTIGISDHLNTLKQLPTHEEIKAQLQALEPKLDIYFGVELDFDSNADEFILTEKIRDEYGFQYAIGGAHQSYGATTIEGAADTNHQHHLKTCRNPLVDVLVHPWWFHEGDFGKNARFYSPDLSFVKSRHVKELAEVALETGTAIEINTGAIFFDNAAYTEQFKQDYKEYLAELNKAGVTFAVGTDAHSIIGLQQIPFAWKLLEEMGVPEDRVWKPRGEPLVARSR